MHPLSMRVIKLALERLLEDRPMMTPEYIKAAEVELARFTKFVADHEQRRAGWEARQGGQA